MKRLPVGDLPFWPRLLSREEAARYVGTSPVTFDQEVQAGIWPAPLRRGPHGGRLTWDRLALDRAADRASGLVETPAPHSISPAPSTTGWTALEAFKAKHGRHRRP